MQGLESSFDGECFLEMAVSALNIGDYASASLRKESLLEMNSSNGEGFVWSLDRRGGSKYTDAMALTSRIFLPRQEDCTVIPETGRTEANYRFFYSSFFLHGGRKMPTCYLTAFYQMANVLSDLYFRDAIVQYDEALSMIDFYLILSDGMKLTIGRFVGDDAVEDEVDFSIFSKKKLLVSGEMTLDRLLEKIREIK